MSNEELAVLIQQGEQDRLPELWAQVEQFVSMKAATMADKLNGFGGVTEEDLYQSGYLALVAAVEDYKPDAGASFVYWLALHLKTAFAAAAGYRSQKRDMIDFAIDLDAPVHDTEALTLGDAVEDTHAAQDYEDAEHRIWLEQLRSTLDKAMEALPERQQAVVKAHHYQGKTLHEIAVAQGCATENVRQLEIQAFRTLRRNKRRNHLADFMEERTPYFLHVGVAQFKSTGISSVEEIVLKREQLREKGLQLGLL